MSTLSNSAFFRFPHTSTPNINMNIKNCLLKISCKSSCMNPPPLSSSHQLSSTSQKKCDWNMFQKMVAIILGMVEGRIDVVGKKEALPKTIDPKVQLAGNFAPVPETEATSGPLEVEGHLPHALEGGVYIRNGANPAMMEPRAGHHLFDGDGMLHAVRFHKGGIATYCCRYTRTYRLQMEQALGCTLFPKAIGELHGHSGLARLLLFYTRSLFGLVEPDDGMGTANAGVVFFNGHLLAMSEDDLPYALKITHSGELQTLGRYNFDGQLTASSMIAHPKIDARTGEMFALSYDVINLPYLRYFKFSPLGVKGPDVSISLSEPTMVHDFAITQNYVVIPDQQVVFRLHRMLSGGSPVVLDSQKMPRFGILPRDDTDESRLKWIDVPDCFCFHLWNAWEDGDDVVIIGSHMTPPDSIFNEPDLPFQSLLSEIRLNTKTGASTRRRLVMNLNLEAGQVNRNWLGRKTRYAYMAIVEPWPKVSGIAKVDLIPHHHGSNTKDDDDNNVVAKFMYEPGCYGGEPFFVPRSSNPEVEAAEDEGYVLTFVHNEESGESRLLILDAASALKPLASVKLPSRVPYGFHGTFVTAKELAHQPQ